MAAMDEFLAEYYGNTTKTAAAEPTAEALEKQASVELFMKLASEQKIDLKSMPDDQVQALYNNWVSKTAEFPPKKEEDKDEKKHEEAKKEHEEKKAAAEKFAEAEFLGRVMAHSMVAEMRKIAEAASTPAVKVAEIPEAFKKHMAGKEGEKPPEEKKDDKKEEKKEEKKAAPHHGKEASAIDQLALDHAVKLAEAAKLDPEVAGQKVAAVLILGLQPDDTKIASAPDLNAAVHVRALELLEKAGYEVSYT